MIFSALDKYGCVFLHSTCHFAHIFVLFSAFCNDVLWCIFFSFRTSGSAFVAARGRVLFVVQSLFSVLLL